MKSSNTILTLAFLILYCVFNSRVSAQWTNSSLPSPNGGYVYSLTTDNKYILAGASEQGVYLSRDNGAHWSFLGLKKTLLYFNCLAINDSNFYAATSNGLFHSVDEGRTWTHIDSTLPTKMVSSLSVADNFFTCRSILPWTIPVF